MGWLMAKTYDWVLAPEERAGLGEWRRELLGDVTGAVLEVGAGTGVNLAHYGSGVERLVVTEPDRHMRSQLERKLDSSTVDDVEVRPSSAGELDVDDASFDVVVSTLVLCSVPEPARAVAEAFRVLRPGGRFVYLEHVAATNSERRLRWQHRVEPVWKRVAGNCHLTRHTGDTIRAAGFEIEHERRHELGAAITREKLVGSARKPSAA